MLMSMALPVMCWLSLATPANARQPGVGGGRTICREDLDGAAEADMYLGVPQDVEQPRIHFHPGAFARIAA